MGNVPEPAYTPTYSQTTISEFSLGDDLSPLDLGYPPGPPPDWWPKVPRGSRIRKETYTECGFPKRWIDNEGEPLTLQDETLVTILANGCLAYRMSYRCVEHNQYYWMESAGNKFITDNSRITSEED